MARSSTARSRFGWEKASGNNNSVSAGRRRQGAANGEVRRSFEFEPAIQKFCFATHTRNRKAAPAESCCTALLVSAETGLTHPQGRRGTQQHAQHTAVMGAILILPK